MVVVSVGGSCSCSWYTMIALASFLNSWSISASVTCNIIWGLRSDLFNYMLMDNALYGAQCIIRVGGIHKTSFQQIFD